MYLNNHHFSPNITNKKHISILTSFPFSKLSLTKVKSKILEKVLDFEEAEENCVSLIDYNLRMKVKIKNKLKNQKVNNLKETFSFTKRKNKKTETFRKTESYFPLIKRSQRKIKTFHIFKHLTKKVRFNNLLLESPNIEKGKLKKEKSQRFYTDKNKKLKTRNKTNSINKKVLYNLIEDKKDNYKNNSKSNNSKEDSKSLRTLSSNNIIKDNNNLYNPNYYFSFQSNENLEKNKKPINLKNPLKKSKSTFNSTHIKFLKNTTTYSDFLNSNNKNFNNQEHQTSNFKNTSHKALTNYNTLSILKKPEITKDSFNSIHYSNKSNLFLTSNINNMNSNIINRNNSSFLSFSKNSSHEESQYSNSKIIENKNNSNQENLEDYINKNKKLFKLKIYNRINELEKEMKNLMNKNNKNKKENKILINNMIKKCKYILKIIDDKMNFKIFNIIKAFEKNEIIMNLNKKPSEVSLIIKENYKNRIKINNNNNLRFQNIIKNRHKIYDLMDKNNQIEKRVNDYLDKLLEKI